MFALLALLADAVLVARARRRGRTWPLLRTLSWAAGCLLAALAVSGPLAAAGATSRTAHTTGHVLLSLLAPLLLVLGAPVTLALRALPVHAARRLSRLLRSRPLRFLTVPVVADVLDEQRGALVMYDAGDAVDLLLAVLVCARWYRSGQRQLDLEGPRARPQGVLG